MLSRLFIKHLHLISYNLISLVSLLNMHLMLPKSRVIFVFPIFWIIQKVLAKQNKKLNKSFSSRYFKAVKCFVHKIGSQRAGLYAG